MKARISLLGSALLALTSAYGVPVPAASLPADYVHGDSSPNQSQTSGWAFTVGAPIKVTALGFFDSGLDGLADPHTVGLWSSATGSNSGTLLATTVIPEGAGAPMINKFRYIGIAPITLQVGTLYVIGAHYPGAYGYGTLDPDPQDRDGFTNVYTNVLSTFGAGINYIEPRSSSQQTTGLNFPNFNHDVANWATYPIFGPNFLYEAASPPNSVPDTGTQGLGTLALIGLLVAARRRPKAAA